MHILLQTNLRGSGPEPPDHGRTNLRRAGLAGECIGIRKEVALEAPGSGIEIGDEPGLLCLRLDEILAGCKSRLLEPESDIKDGCAFGNGHRSGEDIAAGNAVIDLCDGLRVVEAVFTGTEGSPSDPTHQVKSEPGAHHSSRLQLAANPNRG